MQVTNLTEFCFVLSGGVILSPNEADVTVDDAKYQNDSTLNQQIDALQNENFISITGKPSDPFPSNSLFTPPVVVQSQDTHSSVFDIQGAEGQLQGEFSVQDSSGIYGIYCTGYGALTLDMANDSSGLAERGGFACMYDSDGFGDVSSGFAVSPDGHTFMYRNVYMYNLPTADPHAAGQLWNSAGTLKVSAG
jgi:hypothetical protein